MCTAKIPPRPCLFLLAALFLLARFTLERYRDNSTFSAAVALVSRLYPWKITPICWER